jgi:response regulator RpfG family c-di-GMP phosphodiesterase
MSSKPLHNILVVDDEPDVVKSVQDLLRMDYRVLGATRASDGIKIMETEEVHVVMSDQRMPEMTGVQFLDKVKGRHPGAIRMLFTGYADITAIIDAINQGNIYKYITKPWDPDELQEVIRQAVKKYEELSNARSQSVALAEFRRSHDQTIETAQCRAREALAILNDSNLSAEHKNKKAEEILSELLKQLPGK